jgi:hypothetical protein
MSTNVSPPDPKLGMPVDVSKFKSPMIGVFQVTVTVQAVRLAYETSLENWLKGYMIRNGLAFAEQPIVNQGGKRLLVAFESSDGLQNNFTRLMVYRNGDALILVRYDLPMPLKQPLARLQMKTLDSFHIIVPIDGSVEDAKNFTLGEAVRLSYPASWELRAPQTSDPDNMSVQLYNKGAGGAVDGLIRITAVRRTSQTSLKQQTDDVLDYLDKTLNVSPATLLSSDKAPAAERFVFSKLDVYEVMAKAGGSVNNEVRLAMLGDKDWYVTFVLFSPRAADNLQTWARNVESLDLLIRRLR